MTVDRLDQLLKFHSQDPKDTFVLFALAKEYEGRKQWQAALEKYKQILKVDAEYLGVFLHLGKLYEILNKQADALQIYDQGIDIARDAKDARALAELLEAKEILDDE